MGDYLFLNKNYLYKSMVDKFFNFGILKLKFDLESVRRFFLV